MEYSVNAGQMKKLDSYTINEIGIPALVLMERAAAAIAEGISEECGRDDRILVMCGTGNNGGDGLAAARILRQKGYDVSVTVISGLKDAPAVRSDKDDICEGTHVGTEQKKNMAAKTTEEWEKQYSIAKRIGVNIVTEYDINEYNIIIDAIFGIGLSKAVAGAYRDAIEGINSSAAKVYAADIPSGISADTGQIMGVAVKADMTFTFGYMKNGMLVYPGAEYSGRIKVSDIGFPDITDIADKDMVCYHKDIKGVEIGKRRADSNKGSYGRVLIIAGSYGMPGAACLAAKAAYLSGAGLVRVMTCREGIQIINSYLPEALTGCYDNQEDVIEALSWATSVLIGPGLSVNEEAELLLETVLKNVRTQLVADADALNILSERGRVSVDMIPKGTILTPHIKELSRLTGIEVSSIKANIFDMARKCAYNNSLIYVCKDSRTVVADGERMYVNITGNNGMATGGSGDVLAGIIAGLAGTGLEAYKAAVSGTFIHGYAGDMAAAKLSEDSMLAGDIADNIPEVMKLLRNGRGL